MAPKVERLECFDETALDGLRDTLLDDAAAIVQMVERGVAELWRINGGESHLVTRIEGGELVVMCYQGRDAVGIALVVERAARRRGIQSVRFHTNRPALQRLLSRFGFVEIERVYQVRLNGGR